jgi:hypothetical protein
MPTKKKTKAKRRVVRFKPGKGLRAARKSSPRKYGARLRRR